MTTRGRQKRTEVKGFKNKTSHFTLVCLKVQHWISWPPQLEQVQAPSPGLGPRPPELDRRTRIKPASHWGVLFLPAWHQDPPSGFCSGSVCWFSGRRRGERSTRQPRRLPPPPWCPPPWCPPPRCPPPGTSPAPSSGPSSVLPLWGPGWCWCSPEAAGWTRCHFCGQTGNLRGSAGQSSSGLTFDLCIRLSKLSPGRSNSRRQASPPVVGRLAVSIWWATNRFMPLKFYFLSCFNGEKKICIKEKVSNIRILW